MQTLQWLLFESTLAMAVVGVLVNFAFLVRWRRGGTARPLLVTLALTGVWAIVQSAVETQRETAQRIMHVVEEDLIVSRTTGLAGVLAPDFAAGRMDARDFIELVRSRLKQIDIRTLGRSNFELSNQSADRFDLAVTYFSQIRLQNEMGMVRSSWRITFARVPAGWKIRAIEPVEINNARVPTWDELPR